MQSDFCCDSCHCSVTAVATEVLHISNSVTLVLTSVTRHFKSALWVELKCVDHLVWNVWTKFVQFETEVGDGDTLWSRPRLSVNDIKQRIFRINNFRVVSTLYWLDFAFSARARDVRASSYGSDNEHHKETKEQRPCQLARSFDASRTASMFIVWSLTTIVTSVVIAVLLNAEQSSAKLTACQLKVFVRGRFLCLCENDPLTTYGRSNCCIGKSMPSTHMEAKFRWCCLGIMMTRRIYICLDGCHDFPQFRDNRLDTCQYGVTHVATVVPWLCSSLFFFVRLRRFLFPSKTRTVGEFKCTPWQEVVDFLRHRIYIMDDC